MKVNVKNSLKNTDLNKTNFPLSIIDLEANTGLLLMSLHNKNIGNVILYGVEKDDNLFKICLINLIMILIN